MTMKTAAYSLLIFFILRTGVLCDRVSEKRQTTTACSIDTFTCSNGLCVDSSLVCDGLADCSDSSDETQNLCSKLFKKCPSYAFRCKYGACVDQSAKCNGINDCVDGSDENTPECKQNSQTSLQSNNGSRCRSFEEYTCNSGQCVDSTSTCDGIKDCNDGSDETSTLCKLFQCPKYTFMCNYGACISKEYKCDGKVDCLDGSDETACAPHKTQQQASTTKRPKPTQVIRTSTIKPTMQPNTKKTCMVPTQEGSLYHFDNSDQESVLSPGSVVDQYRIVVETCKPGYYKAYPDRYIICSATGKWEPIMPDKLCLRICPPLMSDSLNLKCTFNGERVDCSSSSAPGTKLRPSCKITHGLPNGEIETPIELICQPDGKWSRQLYKCVPHCGRTFTPHKLLITNGSKAKYGSAPWNVGIYKKDNNEYGMICGGTLISLNLVISAAHCFAEEGSTDRIILNNDMYKVGVGKYERNISVVDNEFTQIIDVGLIYLKEDYYGASGFHADDIATIVLATTVKISSVVLPVCMDWNKNYGTTPSGSVGQVVGWGRTENKTLSPTLLEAFLPYIDHFKCRNMYKNGFELYVTRDKFCAGSESGQGVQEGDSGAGLTFEHNELHFLSGIVSVKDRNTKNAIAVFTDVNYHIQWIRDIYTNNSSTV